MYDEERWPTAGLATASAELSAGVGRSPFAQQPPATPPSKSSNAAAGGAIGRRPRERAPRREASSPMPFGTPLTNAASTKGARARKERPPWREGAPGSFASDSGSYFRMCQSKRRRGGCASLTGLGPTIRLSHSPFVTWNQPLSQGGSAELPRSAAIYRWCSIPQKHEKCATC